jgi:hypothetical protein
MTVHMDTSWLTGHSQFSHYPCCQFALLHLSHRHSDCLQNYLSFSKDALLATSSLTYAQVSCC